MVDTVVKPGVPKVSPTPTPEIQTDARGKEIIHSGGQVLDPAFLFVRVTDGKVFLASKRPPAIGTDNHLAMAKHWLDERGVCESLIIEKAGF